ncbi:type I restriction endonuclease subunit R [Chryseobacterium sp. H3056]|jgi:type I restriction enzyme R subunit|uniref:Type I restriction enzyme endonuclease subunit n=1 Tax=Kaistella daneshvariae TaxID=2487074 RepID=A0A3N0WSP8_9FLAO|nr:type I restriction endonuclease subunit R [Kaistella daneshvariae]ROI08116.1 type I restriction endonuclease subunit R [Kaistella daneshvariae]
MAAVISEDHIEQVIIQEFVEIGYQYLNGVEISPESLYEEREYNEVVLKNRLQEAIAKHNPTVPYEAQDEALKKVLRSDSPELFQNNYQFHKYLTDGVDVEYRKGDRIAGDKVWLVDYDNPTNNEFLVVNQFTVIEGNINKRPDIILFVNGLPLVVIELKNAADENADVNAAFNQLQTYKQAIPSLFQYNALLIASDGWDALYGSLTSPKQFFVPWKSIDGQLVADEHIPQMEVMVKGMLNKAVLLDLIRHFTLFHQNKEQFIKIVPRYHQYFAVNKAVEATKKATADAGDQRAGVIWHTQGSGKSLSMAFYSGKLVLALNNPTLVILTDRNDLDDQLFETFSLSQDILRQTPVQAENREHLKNILSVASGGIVFTTIQKFLPEIEEKIDLGDGKFKNIKGQFDELSDRRNIVVIADEAHRSQYDFIDGFAKHMRDALPNASFIGFTGTPIENTDKNTQAVFGDYIDVYDIQQAVEDGATVRIYYENRLAKITLKEEHKYKIDEQLNLVAEEMSDYGEQDEGVSYDIENKKAKWARLEAIVGHPDRLRLIAADVISHFEARNEILDGKGMIVCMSRRIAVELYAEIVKKRPDWHSDKETEGAIKVVMTGSSSDPLHFQPHVRSKQKRKALGDRLKDPNDSLKLAIVRDMWLTGFDAPSLHTMYIDKPMKGHNLMQAIARVNRVYKDKEGGLVVDFIGIATDLKKALSTYVESGGKGKPAFDQEDAASVMMTKYEIVAQMFSEQPTDKNEGKGFDYHSFFMMTPKEKLYFPIKAANFILGLEDGKARFTNAVTALSKSFAISVPHPATIDIRSEVGLFQAIKARIVKVTQSTRKKSDEEVETAIKQILSDAVVAEEVIDIFDAAGIKKPDISILSDEFLAEVKGMKHKNLAFELLKKLLNDEVKTRQRTNVVQSRKFSEMIENAVKRYQNNLITSAEVIQELIKLAKDLKEADRKGEDLGLDFREYAFYSALEVNDSAVSILGDDILRHIATELVDTIKNNSTIDWTVRENIQARMRIAVKRILRKYGYPPDLELKATETVLEQAKLMAGAIY